MYLRETATIAVVLALIVGGLVLCKHGHMVLGVTSCTLGAFTSLGYLYFVKLRPFGLAKQAFLDAVGRHEFVPLPDKQWAKGVKKLLRDFDGFGDIFLDLELVHGVDKEVGRFFAGRYLTTGEGMNFGYFMIGQLFSSKFQQFEIEKILDIGGEFEFEEEMALGSVPAPVHQALRAFPYDFHFRDGYFMVDFDARYLREDNFARSFDEMMVAIESVPLG